MKSFFQFIRYSTVGVFFAGIVSVLAGCTEREAGLGLVLLILLQFCSGPIDDGMDDGALTATGPHIYWTEIFDDVIMRCALADIPCNAADAQVVAQDGSEFDAPYGTALD